MGMAGKFLGEVALKKVLKYASENPEDNLQKILNFFERLPFDQEIKEKFEIGQQALQARDNNWYQLAKRVLTEANPRYQENLIKNLFLNTWFLGVPKQRELSHKYGVNIPFALLIDPTARCNLNCTGCWAGDYDQKDELSYAILDRIIGEARNIGIYFILFSGGEPLLRRDHLLALASKYRDMAFHAFTNGTLIDEAFVAKVSELGNFGFAISIEGFRETTDARRGHGTFERVIKAMDLLREAGVIFGFSSTYTRHNTREVGSEEFIDFMISKGCMFGWYFTYIPIGRDIDLELMATPEQRSYMYEQVQYFRKTKPLAVFDFWNDGELVHGCIAGGRRYLHINAAGEVEPCAFVHFATHNIKDLTLLEALGTPLMRAYQKRQPFNNNMLRPCPVIDNPEALAEMVAEAGAYPTQLSCCTDARELANKLHDYARAWGEVAESIWSKEKEKATKCSREVSNW